MTITVIIPTYKRNKLLPRAINSVLNQTYLYCEVIVVDDNNEDSLEREANKILMKQYHANDRVIYLQHRHNQGGSTARNTGWKSSNSDYIAFLDDDDEFLPNKIEKQVELLESLHEDWGACYCNIKRIKNNKLMKISENYLFGNLQFQLLSKIFDPAAGSTLLVRRKVLEVLNGFDESFIRHQDQEFLVRFFRKYKLALVPDILVKVHMDCSLNRPSPFMLENTEQHYLSYMKADIESHGRQKSQQIYKVHAYELTEQYLLLGHWKKGTYWFTKSGYTFTLKLIRFLVNMYLIKIFNLIKYQ